MTRGLVIPADELEWRFTTSGGPGGQHANKVNTRVELRFDIRGSPSLGPRQRARLIERLGPELRLVVDDERSQVRNRQLHAIGRSAIHRDPRHAVRHPRPTNTPCRVGSTRPRVSRQQPCRRAPLESI